MKDFVSSYWISLVALVASMSVVCAIFVPYGFAWAGLAGVSLALAAAGFLTTGSHSDSARSIWQVIHDVETEPRLAVAVPERVATPAGGTQLRLKGKGTL